MRRINVGEITLAVTEEGTGDPVIFLHGFPQTSRSWRHQLPAVAAAGFHAIAPDLRGYGESDAPPAVSVYAFPKLIGDVAGLIASVGGRAHVVGHDWGGSIAWALATRMPELVRSLVIVTGPHPVASAEARQLMEQAQKSWYMLLFQFPDVAEQWLMNDGAANLRRFVFDTAAPGAFPDEERDLLCASLARPGRMTAPLNYYRANIPPENWLKPPPDLPPVTVPTTVIWGGADAYMSPVLLDLSLKKVTGPVRVERLPGVSHWVPEEAPDAVNAILVDTLATPPH